MWWWRCWSVPRRVPRAGRAVRRPDAGQDTRPCWSVFTAQVTAGVSVLARPHMTLRLGVLSLGIWLLEAGMFLALLPALGLPGPAPPGPCWPWAVTNLGLLVPSTPGFIGPFHFFCMQTMMALGVAPAASFAYAVLVHATFYVPITLWGLLALFTYGVEFARLRTITRAASRLPRSAPPPSSSTPPRARPGWSRRSPPSACRGGRLACWSR